MIRGSFIFALFLAPFFFPFLFTIVGIGIAAFILPTAAIATGVLIDMLYASSFPVPIGTLSAVVFVAIAFFMRRFIQTHIMSA